MKIANLMIITLAINLNACGAGNGTGDNTTREGKANSNPNLESDFDTDKSANVQDTVDDSELAGQTISSQVDVTISDLAEEAVSSGTSLSLSSLETSGELRRFRECVEVEDTAVVTVARSSEGRRERDGVNRKVTIAHSFSEQRERTWSRPDSKIACHENGKHADVPVEDMTNISLGVAFEKTRSHIATIENKAKNRTITRSTKFEVKGERQITWESVTNAEASIAIEKTISSKVSRKLQLNNKNGEMLLMDNEVATSETDPLRSVLVRDSSTLVPLSRTLKSGTVIATGKDGGRIETTFANVVWNLEGGCMATSGIITGSIYRADEDQPAKSFSIDFDNEDKVIAFDDGSVFDYTPDGCDLEDAGTIKDVDSLSDVAVAAE